MAEGWGNPRDNTNATTVRPTHVDSGAGTPKWFTDAQNTRIHAQDFNLVLAVIRNVMSFYGITDSEGDDTVLRQALQKFLPLTGGTVTGSFVQSIAGGGVSNLIVQGEGLTNLICRRSSADATPPSITTHKTRGTISSFAAVVQNDVIGRFDSLAYTGSGFTTVARTENTVIAASPSATDLQSRMRILLCPAGSASVSEFLRIEHATGISMGGANVVIDQNRHHRLRSYTVGTVPSASPAGQMIYVSNDAAGPVVAHSDGTIWRREYDNAQVAT